MNVLVEKVSIMMTIATPASILLGATTARAMKDTFPKESIVKVSLIVGCFLNGMNYHLNNNNVFADINECDGERGKDYDNDCHECRNTVGSYTCVCKDGYELDTTSKPKCTGMS